MTYLEAIGKVLAVGLVLGAGLPALFAVGLAAFSRGEGGARGGDGAQGATGTGTGSGSIGAPNPALKALGVALFAVVALVIVVGILYITRGTISHHFGVDPVPFLG